MSSPRSTERAPGAPLDADVLIVGYGPVGQCLAALLGAAGHRVIVCERRAGRYETPRAGHFDHEIMRIFQSMRVADEVDHVADPAHLYEFLDTDGIVLSRLPRGWTSPSGWETSYHFYQPELEDVLDSAVARQPSVDVRFGVTVIGVRLEHGRVVATLEDGSELSALYLVGADGANSAIRRTTTIGTEDLGFQADWLVIDVRPLPGAAVPQVPDSGQVMDPARPTYVGRAAQRYFRWEFMVVEGDDPAAMVTPERVWQLLAPWTGPDRAELIRQRIYTFRSIVADTFRDGSVLLAGDAAHVMPPFLGQGMSSGIRDAATLSWILDLVLRGVARSELLDLYTASRRPHVLEYIRESMKIGTVVSDRDPESVRRRREAMLTATEVPPPFQPPIGAGFAVSDPLAGRLAVQPLLRTADGQTARSDDLLGGGFALFTLAPLDADAASKAADLDRAVGLTSVILGDGGIEEEGDALSGWLRDVGAVAVVVRPDFYIYGTSRDLAGVTGLLTALSDELSLVDDLSRGTA